MECGLHGPSPLSFSAGARLGPFQDRVEVYLPQKDGRGFCRGLFSNSRRGLANKALEFWRMFLISPAEDWTQALDALLGNRDRPEFGDKRTRDNRGYGSERSAGFSRGWLHV